MHRGASLKRIPVDLRVLKQTDLQPLHHPPQVCVHSCFYTNDSHNKHIKKHMMCGTIKSLIFAQYLYTISEKKFIKLPCSVMRLPFDNQFLKMPSKSFVSGNCKTIFQNLYRRQRQYFHCTTQRRARQRRRNLDAILSTFKPNRLERYVDIIRKLYRIFISLSILQLKF